MPRFGRRSAWLAIGLSALVFGAVGCGSSGSRVAGDLTEESPVPVDSYVVPTKPSASGSKPRKPSPTAKARRISKPGSAVADARGSEDKSGRLGSVPKRSATSPTQPERRTDAAQRSLEDEAVRLTNAARQREGCRALRTEERLRTAARAHSADMAARRYFSHDSLDGRSPWDRIRATGYAYPAAENIARGQRTPREVVDAWLDSPGHRANIMNCDLKAIGIGVRLGTGGPWWTQNFGSR
ncbi:CAP domain-containing protein [Acrocarpospora sp. B8E8]|uniref:CAP domain-containing protein n=1 Tax=Acrocarpospora sp. B8E8 TaxID=3153572 RepID=UPI00325EF047